MKVVHLAVLSLNPLSSFIAGAAYRVSKAFYGAMYTSLAWVPRGVAKAKLETPQGENDAKAANGAEEVDVAEGAEEMPPMDVADVAEMASEDGSEVDIGSVLANDLDNLTFYASNKDDPLLEGVDDEVFDEEELDELQVRATDAMLIATKSGEEASHVEYYLFDDEPDSDDDEPYAPNTYVHHDVLLRSLPLCGAYTSVGGANLAAVGYFTPGIDVWDVDAVQAVMPVQTLGGYAKAPKKKKKGTGSSKKPRLKLQADSHSDAVMCVSWNNVQREYLASGSADKTVKIWDIESAHCACTLTHHADKVQAVAFHPADEATLLTGSFDQTVHAVDVRAQKSTATWSVDADVECVRWLPAPDGAVQRVLVATESGAIYVYDPRQPDSPLMQWAAHDVAASAVAVSRDVPGLLVTGGVDKRLKAWHVGDGKPELLIDAPSALGAVFSADFCPATSPAPSASSAKVSPFVLAYGGQKDRVEVVDLGVQHEALRTRYRAHIGDAAFDVMQRRAKRMDLPAKKLEAE